MSSPAGSSGAPRDATGTRTGVSIQSIDVRVPKDPNKKFSIMQFPRFCKCQEGQSCKCKEGQLNVDFSKWAQPTIKREHNQVRSESFTDSYPKFGAGSEYGREAREEAKKKKYGHKSKHNKQEDLPWIIKTGEKNGRKLRGVRQGGVDENSSYYILVQAADGALEAFPVKGWYNFKPVQTYKALSYEEAEKELTNMNRKLNLSNALIRKRLKKDEDGDDDEKDNSKKLKSKAHKRYGDDTDERTNSSDDSSDDDGDEDTPKSNKTMKKGAPSKKKQRSWDEQEEDSDGREGRELDYISSSGSESDFEMSKDGCYLKGVAEEDGLRKFLDSGDEEEEEKRENNDDEEEEESDDDKKYERGVKKNEAEKKTKKSNEKKTRKEDCGSSDFIDSDVRSSSFELEKATVTKLGESPLEPSVEERKALDECSPASPTASDNPAKKPRLDVPSTSSSSGASSSVHEWVNEDLVRRYLQRKPMTTTELLQKFKSPKTGLKPEQLVVHVAKILKKINPVKQTIKGRIYLFIKS